ncbi:hypothetical protein ES705_17605 [subsurface metagenome]
MGYLVSQFPICYEKLVVESCLLLKAISPVKIVNMDFASK